LLLEPDETLLAGLVGLLPQRFALDLELADAPIDLVELGWHGVDLHTELRGRLVHEIDRLVRQVPVGDVARRQRRGRDERGVLDADAVMHLVTLAEAAEDRDGVLDGWLADIHRLEAPLERRVLLDVLPVLVERGRADGVELAAREHRLQHVRRVDRAFGRAGTDDGVELVDEQDDLTLARGDLLQDGLEPLLELAAVLRAGEERADVQLEDALVLETLGHVAAHDALRETLDDRGLAHAGLADEDRVVLRAAREDLDDAPDLLVATDDRIDLALARELGEVATVLLERLILAFGVRIGDALVAPHILERAQHTLVRDAK